MLALHITAASAAQHDICSDSRLQGSLVMSETPWTHSILDLELTFGL